jgi:hypothetical protein
MIACYCRVSSQGQKHDSQRAEIQRWLRRHGLRPSRVHCFEDTETGKTWRRPAFDHLQQAIFAGTVKTVIVWKLDRLSRRQREGVSLLADWCERGLPVVVIITNNFSYGNTRDRQRTAHGGQYIGVFYNNPDFAAYAFRKIGQKLHQNFPSLDALFSCVSLRLSLSSSEPIEKIISSISVIQGRPRI